MERSDENRNRDMGIKAVTWLLRFLCGGLFIFSGFVKAIDPWGTIFKVQDYLAIIDLMMPAPLVRLFVFGLCAVEFIIGCFLFLGCYRKTCPWFALLIMFFMLPLTLWVAVENPVADCGCFGDAWVVSNWFTFFKNVLLTIFLIWLAKFNIRCLCLISPAFQWLAVVVSGLFVIVIELMGFYYQPLLDFRPYKAGTGLYAHDDEELTAPDFSFVYERNGVREEFPSDSVPDEKEGWKFVERKQIAMPVFQPEYLPKEGLHVFDIDTDEDITSELYDYPGRELIVMMPDVKAVSPATTWKLNSLYEWSLENDVRMIGVISGSKEEIDEWEDLSMASYPVYLADDSVIKEVVRGNPGVVFMEDGKIIWKSSLSSIDIDDFMSPDVAGEKTFYQRDDFRILINSLMIYLIIMAFLIFISFTPRIAGLLLGKRPGGQKRGSQHDEENLE